jgi:DNA-binding transcriptional ArsR family regulator
VPNQRERLDRVFQALADGTRRELIERLVAGPASVGDLAGPLAMSLPAVMQHLKVLESSGLISSEKVGRVRTCRIEPAALRAAEEWVSAQRTSWEIRLDRLGDLLATEAAPGRPEPPELSEGEPR